MAIIPQPYRPGHCPHRRSRTTTQRHTSHRRQNIYHTAQTPGYQVTYILACHDQRSWQSRKLSIGPPVLLDHHFSAINAGSMRASSCVVRLQDTTCRTTIQCLARMDLHRSLIFLHSCLGFAVHTVQRERQSTGIECDGMQEQSITSVLLSVFKTNHDTSVTCRAG
jgi:hypothetical protein